MPLVFAVGFERCGTHAVVDILRASCKVSGFVAHEDRPTLCHEAQAYMEGREWQTAEFKEKLEKYRWLSTRIRVVCEANHRLGYFVEELNTLPGAKFVLLIRDPIKTLISRVATLAHWPEVLQRYPEFYQEAARSKVAPGKEEFNLYRIRPKNMQAPLHELYLEEWVMNYRETMKQLSTVKSLFILETEKITISVDKLLNFVDFSCFDFAKAREQSKIASDSVHAMTDKTDFIKFANDLINPHAQKIISYIQQNFPNDSVITRLTKGV